jgi:RecA-family ATPase
VNLEDPLEEMQLRLSAAMQHYGIKHSDINNKLFMDAEDTMQIVMAAESREGLVQNDALLMFMAERIQDKNIGVVIIDPFVSTHMVNETTMPACNPSSPCSEN